MRDDAVTFGAVDVINDDHFFLAMLLVFLVFLVPVMPDDYAAGGNHEAVIGVAG